jgi:hypothetical protein
MASFCYKVLIATGTPTPIAGCSPPHSPFKESFTKNKQLSALKNHVRQTGYKRGRWFAVVSLG